MIFSQLNDERNQLFTQTKRETPSFLLSLVVSLVLIFADAHYHCVKSVRSALSFITSPLQYFSDYPFHVLDWGRALLSSKQALIEENDKLHQQHLMLQTQLQHFTSIHHENTTLKELLAISKASGRRSVGASVLSIDSNHGRQLLILNKGQRDNVMSGQPVLDQHGVVGQVLDVGLMTSTVLLISDSMSAVPVRNNRTGEMAILIGTNKSNQLSLIHLPKTSSVMSGDLLVTSGLGGRYPEGYPVGRVSEVVNTPGEEFIKVRVTPMAWLDRTRLVLLVWPSEEHYAISAELDERLHRMRPVS